MCRLGPTEAVCESQYFHVNELKQSGDLLSVPPAVVFVHSVLVRESGGS